MNNISKTILILFIAILGASALGVSVAQASSGLVVDFETGVDQNGKPYPLFGEVNFLPGDDVVRWVKVTNNSGKNQDIATEALGYAIPLDPNNVPADDLSRALSIIIREQGGNDLFGGTTGAKTLYDLFERGEILLTANLPGVGDENERQITYDFEISFPIEKANEWQTKITQFDINVGFRGNEGGVVYCNYNGSQDNGETGVDCGGGGCPDCGGGGGGGGTPIPGLTIMKNPQVIFDPEDPDNKATVTWMTSYNSTSQVVYSHKSEAHTFNYSAPNYGYAHADPDPEDLTKVVNHKVVISGLTKGEIYYYRVISHASPATVSREYTFIVPGVKGASTETGGGEQPTGGQQTGGQQTGGQDTGEQDTSIGEKLVQGITSILGLEEKETLSLEDLEELDLLDGEEVGVLLDDIEEKDLPLDMTADLSSILDKFEGSPFLWIFIILLLLILILVIAKLIKDKLEKDKN